MKIERYRQIINELRTEISSGTYQKGDSFPIRSELARRFKTTRTTVNRAIEVLVNDGLLTAQRGSGTVVASLDTRLKIAYIAPKWLMHHMPRSKNCEFVYMPYEEIVHSQAALQLLKSFNGIIWSHPSENDLPWLATIAKKIPSVLVNRQYREIDSICSEYSLLYVKEVSKLLLKYPTSTPYFIAQKKPGMMQRQRFQAFVTACRKHKRFYEKLSLPIDYAGKKACLEKNIDTEGELLLFADDWSHTGAVVTWAREHGRQFGNDISYIDFDNTAPEHVWGLMTTSVIQDFDELTERAFEHLLLSLENSVISQNIFVETKLRHGDSSCSTFNKP